MSSWFGCCDAISATHRSIRERDRGVEGSVSIPTCGGRRQSTARSNTTHKPSGSHKFRLVVKLRIDVTRRMQCIHGSRGRNRKTSTQQTKQEAGKKESLHSSSDHCEDQVTQDDGEPWRTGMASNGL